MKDWTVIAFHEGERQIVADHIKAKSAEKAFKKQLKLKERNGGNDLVQIVAIECALKEDNPCYYADAHGGQV